MATATTQQAIPTISQLQALQQARLAAGIKPGTGTIPGVTTPTQQALPYNAPKATASVAAVQSPTQTSYTAPTSPSGVQWVTDPVTGQATPADQANAPATQATN